MTAKEYLSQAMELEGRIDARMEQIGRLRAMATRGRQLAADIHEDAHQRNWNDALARISALEAELNADVQAWVALKRQIGGAIEGVEKPSHRQLLEYRYLCGWDWRRIANRMHYSIDRVWHMHAEALRGMKAPETPPRC